MWKQPCTSMEPCRHVICMDCVLHVFVCPYKACKSSIDEESSMFLLTHIETQQVTGENHNKLAINSNIICYLFKFTSKRFKSRQLEICAKFDIGKFKTSWYVDILFIFSLLAGEYLHFKREGNRLWLFKMQEKVQWQ